MSQRVKSAEKTGTAPPETKTPATRWVRPRIEWEEEYEPVVFAASCTSQPFNCGAGARN